MVVSECGKCVSGRFARRSVRPIAVRPDQVDSLEAHLSLFKPEKREYAWKDSDCTCGIQGQLK